jgi:hypothetical protein
VFGLDRLLLPEIHRFEGWHITCKQPLLSEEWLLAGIKAGNGQFTLCRG